MPDRPPPTSAELVDALRVAVLAMADAVVMIGRVYGDDSPRAAELAGMTEMLLYDWIPGVQEDAMLRWTGQPWVKERKA